MPSTPYSRRMRTIRPLLLSVVLLISLLLIYRIAPAPAQAGGLVTSCGDDAQLSTMIAGGGSIAFNCGGVGASATIVLSSTKAIGSGSNVSIDGGGKITLSGGNARQLFSVSSGATLALTSLTITNGSSYSGGAIRNDGTVSISNSSLVNNVATGGFGGAITNTGSVTVASSLVANNTALNGYGGGIDSALASSLVVVTDSTMSGNTAKLAGGAIANNGTVRVAGSTFSNNSAGTDYGGGAIENTGPLTISTSTFAQNNAGKGGGVYNEGGNTTITNSTISGNTVNKAPFTGGGLHNERATSGGPGQVSIFASTFANNTAPGGQGGNIFNTAGSGNAIRLQQTILTGGNPGNCAGGVTSNGGNLDSGTSCGFMSPGDAQSVDPRIGPLASNGGATSTHALLGGSVAIDAVDPTRCVDAGGKSLAIDQRGVTRPVDGNADGITRCDIGAYEYQPPLNGSPTPTRTATITVSASPTATRTPTPAIPATFTPTPASTVAPTTSRTATATAFRTVTATASQTATSTASPTTGAVVFPSTGVLDNFTRANGPLGGKWQGSATGYSVNNNAGKVSTGGDIYWAGTAFGVNQEAFVTFTTSNPSASEQDLILKAQSSTAWGAGMIEVWYDPANHRVRVLTFTTLQNWVQSGADIPVTFANGDQLGASADVNGLVKVYRNGTLLATRDVTSWPYFSGGGYIGLWFAGASAAAFDDFGGGNMR